MLGNFFRRYTGNTHMQITNKSFL